MKYLGVDFGLRRVGIATSQGLLAAPLMVIEVKNLDDAVVKLIPITKREAIDQVIVGLPEGKIGKLALKFIAKLKARGLAVEPFDETLSSKNATGLMVEMAIPKKKRVRNDGVAAAIILQNYLDEKN